MRNEKKMYLVKREVMASSITEAVRAPGRIYEISLAADKDQPESKKKNAGFKKKK